MTQVQDTTQLQIRQTLGSTLGIANIHAVPRLTKISVNVGMGDLKGNEALQKSVSENLSLITGQKPVVTRAKKAIAGFKLREKDVIGMRVTLRGKRMNDFLERMITYVFPRIRDFQGLPPSGFDKQGNYSFGLKEHTVFPEVPFTSNERAHGLQITIGTTAKTPDQAVALLQTFGFPFTKQDTPDKR